MKNNQDQFREYLKYVFLLLAAIGVIISIGYIFTNLAIISPDIVNILLVTPIIVFLVPYLSLSLFELKRVESKMQVVSRYFRDIVDEVEAGSDIITAFMNSTRNEYGVLNDDIKKLSNQLSWGIDFDTAILNFADNIGSKSLKRDLLLVIEARRVGGHVEQILKELSEKISVENLRVKERKSNLASNTFTGYISFLIFLFIIVLVYNSLFVELGSSFEDESSSTDVTLNLYLTLFTLLAYELAILSGFLFGLMQENSLISGSPHVVLLVVATFIGFFFFI